VHFAETFIIPATITEFIVEPKYKDDACMIVAAKVR
jgi:hypothetical protein